MPPTRTELRSRAWWDNAGNPEMTALYLERFLNYGLTAAELQAGRPIIGIAQTGNDLVPCNRHHLDLADRVRDGIRDASGVAFEFPVHPLQETGKRPTAALDRNLAYLGLVEVLHGYPLDGVVLTTGCDKTTSACLMAAATVNLPAIVLSGGPMLNGYHAGMRTGSGLVIWRSKRLLASGEIDYDEYIRRVCASAPSIGHCNTMGTALSMNSVAEALGMALPGCAAIPAPYRERAQMAYDTGRRVVDLVREDVTPREIMTLAAFENAIAVASAIAASTNVPVHVNAIARHAGVELSNRDWQRVGADVPVLANTAPAGVPRRGLLPGRRRVRRHAGAAGGGVSARRHRDGLRRTVAENLADVPPADPAVIRPVDDPVAPRGGLLVMTGNLFDSAVMKSSVITDDFRDRYLPPPGRPQAFDLRAIVFDGPEDYHARIEDPELDIDEYCILVIRYTGPVGYPGSAEVVNMELPTGWPGRASPRFPRSATVESGTSDAPSILNASPEAAVGGNLAILRTGDRIRVDLDGARVDVLLSDEEIAARWAEYTPPAVREPDAVAGDLPLHGRAAGQRRLPGARPRLPGHRTHQGDSP